MDIVKILKKNISIIIPAAITILAVLLFVPTVIIQGKISKRLEQSQRLGKEVESAISSAVPARQFEIVKTYEDKHQQDTNEIQKLAIGTTQRPLLSYKIFPEPEESSIQIFNEFKRTYNLAFEKLITDMNALDAPTDIEIRKETGSIQSEIPTGSFDRQAADKGSEKIMELLCKKRCEQIPIYAKPRVFSGYAFWNNWEYRGTEPAVRDCWHCQLAYWIHEDVVDTINKINAGSNTIANSPVKRLLGIRFASGDAANIETGSGTELPIYVTDTSGGLCQPWTTRISNDQIDVVHFSLAVIIRADDVMRFMGELCSEKTHYFSGYKNDQPMQQFKHNQITILQSSIESVDRENQNHKRYRYGQEAIVHLNLICEYIFNKEGYDIIKPDSVKQGLKPSETDLTRQPGTPTPAGRQPKEE
jgi:hypothetical protein